MPIDMFISCCVSFFVMLLRFVGVLLLVWVVHSCSVVRILHEGDPRWGVIDGESVIILEEAGSTTRDLFRSGLDGAHALCFHKAQSLRHRIWESIDLIESEILSPVTTEVSLYAQVPNPPEASTFLIKAPSSLGPPTGAVYLPPFSTLFDFHMDLGFVVGSATQHQDLDELFAGLVMVNSFLPRDVQILQGEVNESHNIPGLTRAGPYIRLFSPQQRLTDILPSLIFSYIRNREPAQAALTGDLQQMLLDVLQQMRQSHTLQPGDVVMVSAAPHAVAYRPLMDSLDRVVRFLFNDSLYRNFLVWWEEQFHSGNYLQVGHQIRASVSSLDDSVKLGTQDFKIKADSWKNWKTSLPHVDRNPNFLMSVMTSVPLWIAFIGSVVGIAALLRCCRQGQTKVKSQ